MTSSLTATEKKVTAITAKLAATKTEQQLHEKKKLEERWGTDFGYVITKITDLVLLDNLKSTVEEWLAVMLLL